MVVDWMPEWMPLEDMEDMFSEMIGEQAQKMNKVYPECLIF